MEVDNLKQELHDLKMQLQQVNNNDDGASVKLDGLHEYKQRRMDLLHKYNDVKDATQVIIGALATAEQKTIAEVHAELNLPMD